MTKWKESILSDIAYINPTEQLSQGINAKKIAMTILQPFTKKILGYSIEPYKGGMKFRNGDTIVARITPCLENGKTAYIDILEDNEVGFGSTEYIVIREREGISDKHFLYYFAISSEFRDVAILSMTGSSGRQRVQTEVVKNHSFLLPPLPEQKQIASILSSLDDKIDLLHRQNKTLESMAETLFRQSFIVEAQDDWETKIEKLPIEILDGDRGKNYPNSKELNENGDCLFLNTKNVTEKGFNFYQCQYISREKDLLLRSGKLQRNDVVLTSRGTVGNVAYYDNYINYSDIRINSGMLILRANSLLVDPIFIYCLFTSDYFRNLLDNQISGSAQPQIPIRDLKQIKLIFPSKTITDNFIGMAKPCLNKKFNNDSQIRHLEKIRDILLPKLMNGVVKLN